MRWILLWVSIGCKYDQNPIKTVDRFSMLHSFCSACCYHYWNTNNLEIFQQKKTRISFHAHPLFFAEVYPLSATPLWKGDAGLLAIWNNSTPRNRSDAAVRCTLKSQIWLLAKAHDPMQTLQRHSRYYQVIMCLWVQHEFACQWLVSLTRSSLQPSVRETLR